MVQHISPNSYVTGQIFVAPVSARKHGGGVYDEHATHPPRESDNLAITDTLLAVRGQTNHSPACCSRLHGIPAASPFSSCPRRHGLARLAPIRQEPSAPRGWQRLRVAVETRLQEVRGVRLGLFFVLLVVPQDNRKKPGLVQAKIRRKKKRYGL